MPKIISHTPRWLSRPSPGFELFNIAESVQHPTQLARRGSIQKNGNGNGSGTGYAGPNRTIARRGTEIFLVAGKHIRWSDLCMLKDDHEELEATPTKRPKPTGADEASSGDDEGPEDLSYRVLKVPVSEQIRQISVSPNGDLLAIATSHTVHIALLPDSSFLGQLPNKAIKLKVYTIGPTTHVLSQSQITNLLWHPFGVGGNCLVTVTVDAVVRLWEFRLDNRWSSDSPSLAVDLKKLIIGSSEEESFAPNKFGRNRSFSSDAIGLEVASACFGGTGYSDEVPWSAITLWLAMKGGDVYALCPLLPSKWQPSSTLIPALSTSTVAQAALHQESDSEESRQYRDQYDWIQNLDGQDPILTSRESESSPEIEIYDRPSNRSAIPRMQGPFKLFSEDIDEDLELSDIHVIAGKFDAGDLLNEFDSDSEEEWMDEACISVATICLLTRSGRVYISLDLEGVEGQWLPRKKPRRLLPPPNDPYLVMLEGLDTLTSDDMLDLEWPTFSADPNSRYSCFTTHSKGVYFFSLDPWIQSLDKELKSNEITGAPFRMDVIRNGPGSLRERILSFEQDRESNSSFVPSCLSLKDSDLGYFVLTSVNGHPHAATLDQPHPESSPIVKHEAEGHEILEMGLLETGSLRVSYQPSDDFWQGSSLPTFVKDHVPSRHQRMVKGEIRLSTATLDLMTKAHRFTSFETHRLGLAAADLFRRCERLQEELRDQIKRANEVAQLTERITGEGDAYLDRRKGPNPPSLDERCRIAQDRHHDLADRLDCLRKKASKYSGKDLSTQEKQWFSEVQKANEMITNPDTEQQEQTEAALVLWQRCSDAQRLSEDLIARAKEASYDEEQGNGDGMNTIPSGLRKAKETQVMNLLERQSALIDAEQLRLERLGIAVTF